MENEFKDATILNKKEDLKQFSEYLGVDYEDFYEMNYKKTYTEEIDFDDYSR